MQDKYHKVITLINREVSLQAFEKYTLKSQINQNQLFTAIRKAETHGFPRFNIWRMLLEVMPISGGWEQKKSALESSRKKWLQLKQFSRTGIKAGNVKQSPLPKNPLMKNMAKTEKKQTDTDSFLNEQIKKDVDRTYQQMQFFNDPSVLKLLTSVLFVWCKSNPDISYKQGMNELLASIVYVYFQEAIPSDFEPSNELEKKFFFLNSIAHSEADIYVVFEKIMNIQKDMYKESLDEKVKGQVNPNSKNNSPILQRIIQIQDQKLKVLDLELFRILKLQDVKAKTFLLRWIRCMHTREFGLVNSLVIWDSIFLDAFQSPNSKNRHQYEFIDSICLAMFIYMRSIVLTRETANQILQIYQKYPQLQGHYLKELVTLGWTVCVELRKLNNNQNANSNWYQQEGKTKNLGLMERGGYDDTVKKQYVQHVKKEQQPFLGRIIEVKSQNQQSQKNNVKQSPSRQQISPKAEIPKVKQIEKSSQKVQQKGLDNPSSNHPQPIHHLGHHHIEKQIVFKYQQLKEAIQNLKKSIEFNDDIQSRAFANKALKVLESKFKK